MRCGSPELDPGATALRRRLEPREQRLGERESDAESADQQARLTRSATDRQSHEQAFRLAVARIHQEHAVADDLELGAFSQPSRRLTIVLERRSVALQPAPRRQGWIGRPEPSA